MPGDKRILSTLFSVVMLYIALTAANLFDPYVPDWVPAGINRPIILALLLWVVVFVGLSRRRFLMPGGLWFVLLSAYALLHGFGTNKSSWLTNYVDVAANYLLFVLTINVLRSKEDLRIYGVVALSIIASGAGLYYWYLYRNGIMGVARPDSFHTAYANLNTNTVSLFLVLGVLIGEYLTDDDRMTHVLAMNVSYVVVAILIMFSGSRFGVFLLVVYFVFSNVAKRRMRLGNVALVAAIGAVAMPLLAAVYRNADYFSSRLENVSGYASEIRLVLMFEAFEIFLQNPMWGGNGHLVYDPSVPVHNHVWILNFLTSLGVIGFVLLCGLGYQIVGRPPKDRKAEYVMFLSFLMLVALYAPPFLFYSIGMSFLYYLGRGNVDPISASRTPRTPWPPSPDSHTP